MLFLLDQDGPEPDDTERDSKRGLHVAPNRRDGMVAVKGYLTPEAWAIYEAIFAKYAAPGMCNPDDESPAPHGTPSQEQIDNDHRSLAQRQHDALVAIGRIALNAVNWVNTTDCRSRSSSAPPCKTSNPAPASAPPAAAP